MSPGVIVRSIYSDKTGRPRSGSSTYITDHASPFAQRWGGWFVTGDHGSMRHLGNAFAVDREDPQLVDTESGANQSNLPAFIVKESYLKPTSDIVALMVLEHQTRLHNLITRANYETRQATFLDQSMNEALDRAPDFVSDSTKRRIANVGDAVVRGLFFADESELTSPINGSSGFQQEFSTRGPVDSKGRSLYQMDLSKHMFRFPLSYMILTDHFAGLPPPVMNHIQREFRAILTGQKNPPKGVRLQAEDCQEISEMLQELKSGWLNASISETGF